MPDDQGDGGRAALVAARSSYSRLVAYLAARTGDVAAAEDALSDAFHAALEVWPVRGIPDRPEAWLLTSARRRLIDAERHRQVQRAASPTLTLLNEEAATQATAMSSFPDERLKLLFICAHPAINQAARTPLMLQAVLGLDAARIASAFLVAPGAMSQRLVRAKAKIRDAKIAFTVPEPADLPDRLDAVLDAIYAAYGTGWEDAAGTDSRRRGLTEEALYLARLVVELLPQEAEAHGLLALMLFCESRRAARRTPDGAYVPLSDQAVALWSQPMIADARTALASAATHGHLGRYQLEAAIQSLHATRLEGETPNWATIRDLYDGLVEISPTIGAQIGRAAAVAEADGPLIGLAALDGIDESQVRAYQPYWALRGDLLARLDHHAEAAAALKTAIGLTEDQAIHAFLHSKSERLTQQRR
ncbi:MAG: DUF6596 domain-containing protein [Pseudomonadota bacterium]